MKLRVFLLSILSVFIVAMMYGSYTLGSQIMFQGFDWGSCTGGWYSTLSGNASALQTAGFNVVWMPPCTRCVSGSHGYLPVAYYDGSGNPYGSQSTMISCISTFKGKSFTVCCDLVLNHRCGNSTAQCDFVSPPYANNCAAVVNNDECGCGTGAADTGAGYSAGRDLDHTSAMVQATNKAFEDWLWNTANAGYTGIRFDMCTGYGASYVGTYQSYKSCFAVGEYWDTSTANLKSWVGSSGVPAFDFATKSTLNAVFNNNNYSYLSASGYAPGLIGGNQAPTKAVTFVENHDTASTSHGGQGMLTFPYAYNTWQYEQAYVYIMTHPGVPCVYYPDFWDVADNGGGGGLSGTAFFTKLILLRKHAGVTASSSLSIQAATTTYYAAIVNSHLAVKIGTSGSSWSPGSGWSVGTSGTGYCVWTNN